MLIGCAGQLAIGQFQSRDSSAFCHFLQQLYTTVCNPNPCRNPTVITDPQIGPTGLLIVIFLIRPADPPGSAFCRVPLLPPSSCQSHTR